MGGDAFLLEGEVAPALLEERALPRTLLDRLLFRTRRAGLRRTALGEQVLLEVEPLLEAVAALWPVFRRWLAGRLPPERGPAAAAVHEYLALDPCTVYLRGEERGGRARFYAQLTFTGCAGLAETTAAACVHFAERWWTDERAALTAGLAGAGFAPSGPWREDVVPAPPLFFPLRRGGYALFTDAQALPPAPPGVPPPEGLPWLEVDGALHEGGEVEDVDAALARLRPLAEAAFAERRCRCDLCAPEFRRTDDLPL